MFTVHILLYKITVQKYGPYCRNYCTKLLYKILYVLLELLYRNTVRTVGITVQVLYKNTVRTAEQYCRHIIV